MDILAVRLTFTLGPTRGVGCRVATHLNKSQYKKRKFYRHFCVKHFT